MVRYGFDNPIPGSLASGLLLLALMSPAIAAPAGKLTGTEARQFFNDQGCNACHGVDEQRLGPAFRRVSQRYRDAGPEVLERLALKIRYGGAGAWGTVPMVSYPQLTIQETMPVLRWILALDTEAAGAQSARP